MDRSRSRADHTVERTRQVSTELEEISASVDTITTMTVQIATAAEEQSQVAMDINQSVHAINDASEENTEQMARYAKATGDLSTNVDDLIGQISRFQTGNETSV
jgi:methyl-accepting chemotaxis protein